MEEATAFKEKLASEETLTMQKGTSQPWPALEGSDEDKNRYLQQIMQDVNKHDSEMIDWAIKKNLYKTMQQ